MADSAHASAQLSRASGRSADRRRGVAALLHAVTCGLATPECGSIIARERFEQELCSLVGARSITLIDDVCAEPRAGAMCVAVPSAESGARIEALFSKRAQPDPWTCQLLETAAGVAGLLLEIERARGRGQGARWREQGDGAAPLIGSSTGIRGVRERIERVAGTDFTVLIEGESGTGKELVARQLHDLSHRRKGPFVAVNCAAIVESLLEAELFGIEDRTATGVRGRRGKFEHAHGGTLFLDEVSDLSPTAQAKLLRAIQDLSVERVGGCSTQRIDTRLIAATNRPLGRMVEQGRFRLDLFYRLHGIEIQVPPLRQRREDVIELALYFLDRHRQVRRLRLSAGAGDALLAYDWPGNVRELERVIERGVALAGSDSLEPDDLPPALIGGYTEVLLPSLLANETMRAWGSRYARVVLDRCRNNKRKAARELGISYHTLQGYLRFRPGVQTVACAERKRLAFGEAAACGGKARM